MRSTSAPDLALHPHESEPLLEDYDESMTEPYVAFAAVVDGEEVSKPGRDNPTLAAQIAECLEILRAAQADIPELQKPRVTRQYIYAILFMSVVVTAIAAPSTLFGILFKQIFHFTDDLAREANARLEELRKQEDHDLHQMQTIKADIQPQWMQLFDMLKPYFVQWNAFDRHDRHSANCNDRRDDPNDELNRLRDGVSLFFCTVKRWYDHGQIAPYSDRCYALANDGCAVIQNQSDLTAPVYRYQSQMSQLNDHHFKIMGQISDNEWRLRNDFPGEHFSFIPAAIAAGVGLVAAAAAIVASWRHGVSRENYKTDLRNTHKINECLTDAGQANKLINVLTKFKLYIDHSTTVEQLIGRLETKAVQVEYRAKCRTAFLLGSHDPNAHNFGFFSSGSNRIRNKDIANIIFEKAGLGKTAYRK